MSGADDGSGTTAHSTGLLGPLFADGTKARLQLLFFTYFVASSGFVVFRNVYLEERGLSGSQMGQIGFLLMVAGVVAQPVWGLLTDYFEAERPVLVLGSLTSAVALLSYPLSRGLGYTFLLIAAGTVAYAALRAPIAPITTGMVLSRGYDYGSVRAFGSLAWAVGSLGFGFLVGSLGSVWIVYCYVAGAAVVAVIVWSLPRDRSADETDGASDAEPADDASGGDGPAADEGHDGRADAAEAASVTDDAEAASVTDDAEAASVTDDAEAASVTDDADDPGLAEAVRLLVTDPTFLVVLAASFLLRVSAKGGEAFFSVYMRSLEIRLSVGPWTVAPDGVTGLAWLINSGVEAAAFLLVLRANRSHRWLLVVGGVVLSVPNLVYGLTTQPWLLLASQSLGGVGFAMISVAAVELAHDVATERVTSTAQSLLTGLGYGLGGAAGQLVAGTLLDAVGIMEMYLAIGVVGFVGAAVGLLLSADGRGSGSGSRA